jgi:LDH2 family malate/lactate/ureidoglycolate dehydrogenase
MNDVPPNETFRATRNISVAALREFTIRAFASTGVSQADATLAADALVTTDAWGVFTHGTKSLQGYLRRLRGGGLQATARPAVVSEKAAWAIVDGHSALGMVTSEFAMQLAIAKARAAGIAYIGVRNSCHFGAAGYYAWLAAREGLVGLAMANDIPSVTAPGARGKITGSNPIAYGVPAGKHRPILLDMAISTVAGGKVFAAQTLGQPIPDNWIIGPDGRPTTDASAFPERGALQPMAGHKGYGLALLIESLAGILPGGMFTRQVGAWMSSDPALPTHHGAAFIAIDAGLALPPGDFAKRVDALIDEVHTAPKADGAERIFVPGEK